MDMRGQHGLRIEQVEHEGQTALRVECGEAATMLDGAQTEALIQRLALYRSAMKPAVTRQISHTHDYHITLEPAWFAEPNLTIDGTVLLLRHTGLGWIGFAFDSAALKRMRSDLVQVTALSRHSRRAAAMEMQ